MILRQKAFLGIENFLKGNLHTHTTRSDGKLSPVETINQYISEKYDFLAITDHNIYNYSSFGNDKITIIPGMEIDKNLTSPLGKKSFHTVCLGLTKDNGYKQDEKFPGGEFFNKLDEYQKVLDEVHSKNNLTIYCHPEWSCTNARDFEGLKGNFAMEIYNSGCDIETDCDYNAPYWDELLLQGIKIFGVASDDGHKASHNCNAWVMVKASNEVDSILTALKEGAFYSSTGPEIKDFYIEKGRAFLSSSKAVKAGFIFGNVPNKLKSSEPNSYIKEVEFPVPPNSIYVRAIAIDEKGKRAWTNPIFL